MRRMQTVLLAAAAVSAIGSAALAHRLLASAVEQARREHLAATVEVLGASRSLEAGKRLERGDLAWQAWPKEALRPDFFLRSEDPDAIAALDGAFLLTSYLAGEPLRRQKLVRRGEGGVLSAQIAPGKQAAAIALRDEALFSLIAANDRVDVILFPAKSAKEQAKNGATLRNLRVLASEDKLDRKRGSKAASGKTLIVEVTPEEAEALAAAQSGGDIAVLLNSLGGDAPVAQPSWLADEPTRPGMIRFGFAAQAALQN